MASQDLASGLDTSCNLDLNDLRKGSKDRGRAPVRPRARNVRRHERSSDPRFVGAGSSAFGVRGLPTIDEERPSRNEMITSQLFPRFACRLPCTRVSIMWSDLFAAASLPWMSEAPSGSTMG